MAKVLIATVFGHSPIMRTVTKFGVDRLILLTDSEAEAEQKESIRIIEESIGKVIKIEVYKTEVYDIYKVAKKCVEILDKQDPKDEIIVNVSSGRKPKAVALLFACYARFDIVKKIVYVIEGTNEIMVFPKIRFHVASKERVVLEDIQKNRFKTIEDFWRRTKISRPMIYRYLEELMKQDLIEKTEDGYKITDGGRIVML
jgi:CRISPR locus-related DNA-binding protein